MAEQPRAFARCPRCRKCLGFYGQFTAGARTTCLYCHCSLTLKVDYIKIGRLDSDSFMAGDLVPLRYVVADPRVVKETQIQPLRDTGAVDSPVTIICSCGVMMQGRGLYHLGDTYTCECGRIYNLQREIIEVGSQKIPGLWYWQEM